MFMNDISDTIYDAVEQIILDNLDYIDSRIFSEHTNGILTDMLFKYIDFILTYRHTVANDRLVYTENENIPRTYTYTNITNNIIL